MQLQDQEKQNLGGSIVRSLLLSPEFKLVLISILKMKKFF